MVKKEIEECEKYQDLAREIWGTMEIQKQKLFQWWLGLGFWVTEIKGLLHWGGRSNNHSNNNNNNNNSNNNIDNQKSNNNI